jgi:methionyl-tRNA synthetase
LLVTLLSPVLPRLAEDAAAFLRSENDWDDLDHPLLNHAIRPYQHLLQRVAVPPDFGGII